ncbi:hypothetical protein CRN84_12695 [Budvicia aquatica]|uniref:Uncharacterized protein n=1 Tax=Budvicia aquatica TaxID=82979 RepID=A0A2C6CU09_9GAMM|nr:hypothetical protein CRN84_12695 [Budvicia aquatica]
MTMMTLLKQRQRKACWHCDESTQVCKHGKALSGLPGYRSLSCRGTFQGRYIYAADLPDGNARVGG